ncbi:hypothetical protein [Parasphingorhabdus sp.]|uniref:hypothetical protein n=1 Tax=Parasphingorhabdus sp. TaxID=2709688 RepID=UPI00326332FE
MADVGQRNRGGFSLAQIILEIVDQSIDPGRTQPGRGHHNIDGDVADVPSREDIDQIARIQGFLT